MAPRPHAIRACTPLAVLLFMCPPSSGQSPDPDSPRWKGVMALTEFLGSSGDEALTRFVDDHVSQHLRQSAGASVLGSLRKLRAEFKGLEMAGARPLGPLAARVQFTQGKSLSFELDPQSSERFVRIGPIGGDEGEAQEPESPMPASGLASFRELRAQLSQDAAQGRFSGVVLVAKAGAPLFHEAYGYANKAAGVPNGLDTKFNLGSINKLFTKVAVYQVLESGKLKLDDPIGKYLPQFPSGVRDKVTVRHLLEHRSGWSAYWDNPTWQARHRELRSMSDYMSFIKDIPLEFEPGTRRQYSNTGYEVLGAVVEKASGKSYYDYVRDHVYKPAGMGNTDAYERDGSTPDMAVGYTGERYASDNSDMLAVKGTAAGGGYATAADLVRFARALDEGKLLPPKYANRIRGGGYAGGAPGVSALLDLNVAGDHTVVVLSNFDPPTAERVGMQINHMLQHYAEGGRKYKLGIGLELQEEGIVVAQVMPGSPAARAGLRPGDVILALNGVRVGDDLVKPFDALLTKPDPIVVRVQRGDEVLERTVTPEAIGGSSREAG